MVQGMMFWTVTLSALHLLLPVTLADTLAVNLDISPTNCLFGCFDALSVLKFADIPETAGYYDGYCASPIFTTSLASCVVKYCSEKEVKAGWDKVTEYCEEYGLVSLSSIEDVLASIPSQAAGADGGTGEVQEVDTVAATGEMMNATIVPSAVSFEDGKRTEDVWNREMNFHHAFGWSMYILFGFIVLAAMIERGFTAIRHKSWLSSGTQEIESHRPYRVARTRTWWQRHVAVPALFGKRHVEPWLIFSLPTRLQAILMAIYVLINFVFCCADYDLFTGNMYWSDTNIQLARYIADRTGIMSFYNLPLLFMLGGRNDVFLWLTGWSYATASLFHRCVAFVATMQAIVHSAAYTWLERDILAEEWAEEYWRTGIFATIVMSLLLAFSIRPIRQKCYEVFLIVHIGLAIACIILLFYHVKIFDSEYDPWLWACVGVWVLDRFIRVVRMIVLSFRTFALTSGGQNAKATITYTTSSGLIRLSIRPSAKTKPRPGQYYYIYTPWSITPWENHPFTLASWSKDGENNDNGNGKGTVRLNFLVGPAGGATRRLRHRIEKEAKIAPTTITTITPIAATNHAIDTNPEALKVTKQIDMRIWLEGPYGSTHNLTTFDHVLLIAGGSGVTAILPYVHTLQTKSHVQVSVIWAVTHDDYAKDVLGDELAGVEVQMYVTRDGSAGVEVEKARGGTVAVALDEGHASTSASTSTSTPSSPDATSESEEIKLSDSESLNNSRTGEMEKGRMAMTDAPGVTVYHHRPDISSIIAKQVSSLIGGERMAVLTCGPGGMMDDARAAVVAGYDVVPSNQLAYYEESFGW